MSNAGAIYMIKNKINNKVYIGQTTRTVNERMYEHFKPCIIKSKKYYLYYALNKYGIENFEVSTLVSGIKNTILLNELEIHYMHLYNSRNHKYGYNLKTGGSNLSRNIKMVKLSNCTDIVLYKHPNVKSAEERTIKKKWGLIKSKPRKVYYVKKTNNSWKKKVICLETGQIFNSSVETAKFFNVSQTTISDSCNNKNKTNKLNLNFKYV
jgi:hypothetical protein